jgi:hypothetical protein
MKELSIEEKAKAYDEALKVIKDNLDALNKIAETGTKTVNIQPIKNCFCRAFPELKESEDEKIRKWLISQLKIKSDDTNSDLNIMINKAISWLEEHDEHAKFRDSIQVGDNVTRNENGVLVNLSQLNRVAKKDEKQGEHKPADKEYTFKAIPRLLGMISPTDRAKSYCQKLIDSLEQEGYSTDAKIVRGCLKQMNGEKVAMATMDAWKSTWLEKKGEQKPQGKSALEAINEEKVDNANKVEAKFKVGDWISGYYTNYKVLSVNNDGYLVEDVDGNKINILFENEKFHHFFIIADAKDGDVLIDKSNGKECPFIFKETKPSNIKTDVLNPLSVLGYCGIGGAGFTKGSEWGDTANCTYYPANKEQQNLLFQKMKEGGYEWDAEKKELNKVEQKDVIHKELTEFERAVKQVMEEAIECGDTHNLKADADMLLSLVHKSAWSEEDEKGLSDALWCCKQAASIAKDENDMGNAWYAEHWLKTLKERYTR